MADPLSSRSHARRAFPTLVSPASLMSGGNATIKSRHERAASALSLRDRARLRQKSLAPADSLKGIAA
jgi:hypothetical protein